MNLQIISRVRFIWGSFKATLAFRAELLYTLGLLGKFFKRILVEELKTLSTVNMNGLEGGFSAQNTFFFGLKTLLNALKMKYMEAL